MIRKSLFGVSRLAVNAGLAVTTVVGMSACSVNEIADVPKQDAAAFWFMSNDIKAATIAIGGTQKIVATALSGTQTPMTNLPKPTFFSRNVALATVDSNGVVTGVATTSGVGIVATLTVNGVTHADTTTVAVTAQAKSFKTFKFTDWGGTPLPTEILLGDWLFADYAATDSADMPLTGLAVSFRSLDPKVISVQGTSLSAVNLGKTKVVATATAYGRTMSDTLEFSIFYNNSATIYISAGNFYQNASVISVGGTVTWVNNGYTMEEANVMFDNPSSAIDGGNIPSLLYNASATRTFTAEGTYTYKNTKSGKTGTVIVRKQPQY